MEQEPSRQGRDGQNNDSVARCVGYRWSPRALTRLSDVVSCSNRYVNVLECWVGLDYMWPLRDEIAISSAVEVVVLEICRVVVTRTYG